MQHALMGTRGKAEAETVLGVAAGLGPDIEKLKVDMKSAEVDEHMATSMRLAAALGFNGTPSLVIGDQLVRGFVAKAALVETAAAARVAE